MKLIYTCQSNIRRDPESGDDYYFNFKTGANEWKHPSDNYYEEIVKIERDKLLVAGIVSTYYPTTNRLLIAY